MKSVDSPRVNLDNPLNSENQVTEEDNEDKYVKYSSQQKTRNGYFEMRKHEIQAN